MSDYLNTHPQPCECPFCVAERKLKAQSELAARSGSDEAELRRMLAWAYSGHHLYCDDGELQDSREQPFIDFKRDTIAELKDKMEQRGLNRLHRELHQNDQDQVRHESATSEPQ